jgi:hypothetical protein
MTDSNVGRIPARQHLVLALAAALVAASLFMPRPMNFAPLGAFGLFVGAYAPHRRAWAYPLLVLTAYVVLLGGYAWLVLATVFLGFAGPAVLATRWLRSHVSVARVGGSALASSLWFFLVSNFGSWIVYGAPRGQSLVAHYLAGVPLFWNTIAGDLFFTTVLFGGYALVERVRLRDVALSAHADVRAEGA